MAKREPVRAEGKKTGQGAPSTVCAGKQSIYGWQVAEDKICFIMRRATGVEVRARAGQQFH